MNVQVAPGVFPRGPCSERPGEGSWSVDGQRERLSDTRFREAGVGSSNLPEGTGATLSMRGTATARCRPSRRSGRS